MSNKQIELTLKEVEALEFAFAVVEEEVFGDYEEIDKDDKATLASMRRVLKKINK